MPVRVQTHDSKGWWLLGNASLHDWRHFFLLCGRRLPQTPGGRLGTQWRRRALSSEVTVAASGLGWDPSEKGPGSCALCPPCCSELFQRSSNGFLDVLAASYPFRGLLLSSVLLCLTHSCLIMTTNTMVWMHGRLLCWGNQPPGGIRSLSGHVTSVISTSPEPRVFLKLRWPVIK